MESVLELKPHGYFRKLSNGDVEVMAMVKVPAGKALSDFDGNGNVDAENKVRTLSLEISDSSGSPEEIVERLIVIPRNQINMDNESSIELILKDLGGPQTPPKGKVNVNYLQMDDQ